MKEIKKFEVAGFVAGSVGAGIKKAGRPDIMMVVSEEKANAAAVFTTNKVKAAPVQLSQLVAKKGKARAIVANSGNANACNGERGMADALTMADVAADCLGINTSEVFVASTGVIGAPMPIDRVGAGIVALPGSLKKNGWDDAARAIMTTDTFPKIYGVKENIGGKEVTILGIAKGSGMIHPNMATMLSFVATDAAVETKALKAALKSAVVKTFNRITVDGDTSTNDCVLMLANGVAGNAPVAAEGKEYEKFIKTLEAVLAKLARMVAKDGEGATKLVEVIVAGAKSEADALKAAMAIAHSPLVKTAMFASDANWGRIICAAGYSGAEMDPDKAEVYFDEVCMVKGGVGQGEAAEKKATAVMKKAEYKLTVKLGAGKATAAVLTTDLSHEYVKINAEYRS
jgi:glutamate N-acetyltransferase / amino-acid N-acetyltransferase